MSHYQWRNAAGAPLTASFLIVGCLLPFSLLSLDPSKAITQYGHRVWQSRDGLPQQSVRAVLQTRDGYLWLGTEEGLVRFDGARFRVYETGNTPALPINYVSCLLEASDGGLWIGTLRGLVHFSSGHFTQLRGLPNKQVRALCSDGEGGIWIGTDGGLFHLRPGQRALLIPESRLSKVHIRSLYLDTYGNLWIGTAESGLYRLKEEDLQAFTVLDGLPDSTVRAIHRDRDGNLWVGTARGLGLLRNDKLTTFRPVNGLPNDDVWSICEDRDQNLWIGTDGGGVARLAKGKLTIFDSRGGLSGAHVRSLFEDREGSLWIGTVEGGLNRLQDGLFTVYSSKEGLSSDQTRAVYEDRAGSMWIGTFGGGLNRLRGEAFTVYTKKEGLPDDVVISLYEDGDQVLWIGTLGGLRRLQDGRIVKEPRGSDLKEVSAILGDQHGDLWIGTLSNGVAHLPRRGALTFYTVRDGLTHNHVSSLCRGRDGSLWIGTNAGLNRLRDGKLTSYSGRDGLTTDIVQAIYEDQEATLWVGTLAGLYRFKDGRFTPYTTKDGLFSDYVFTILEDGAGRLWMSCNRGIFAVSKKELTEVAAGKRRHVSSISYDTADGMKSAECNGGYQPAGWKAKDGRLWFATSSGAAVVDPSRLRRNSLPPPVHLEEVVVDRRQIDPTRAAEFPPGPGTLEFRYTALSLVVPERVRFRYKLEGFDRDWVEAGTRRVAYYTNVPPGRYRFRVMATNNDGVWSLTGAALNLSLRPHFYQTVWFYGLCATLVAVTIWSGHRFRVHQIRDRFEAVIAERNRMARDVHDTVAHGLAAISLQLEAVTAMLANKPEQARAHVDRARELVRDGLAEARRFVSGLRPLALETGDLAYALTEVARQMTTEIVDVEIQGTRRRLPAQVENNLLRIGQEAITNAVTHGQARRISVKLKFQSGSVELRVADDGRGLPEEVGSLDGDGHFGLLGMRERAEMLGGQFTLRSEPGKGTEVIVAVPLAGQVENE